MKKKHLLSLGETEKWLEKVNLLSDEMKESFHSIRKVIENLEEVSPEASKELPPPAEIAEDTMAIALYSDGGCRGNPGPGAFAYVVQDHSGTILAEGVEFESLTTNNKMELSGPIKGLREIKDILSAFGKDPLLTRVKVVTDSKYVVDGMKSWVTGWKARGWKKADNKVPENVELWQELDQVKNAFMEIDWVWVRGHIGHPQNEYCDRKANETMDENLP